MGGFRAKDADRERYVEVIESAYVDGQLGEQDRELRVARALTAETLDELHALTRDLQNQPAQVVPQAPAPRVVPPVPAPGASAEPVQWPVPPKGPVIGKVLGSVAAGIVVIAAMGMMSAAGDESFSGGDDYASIPWEEIETAPETRLSSPEVRRFVRRYEAKFDTSEVHEVTFLVPRVKAHVPRRDSAARFDDWTWDGRWRRVAEAQDVDGPTDLVDLRTLDVKALFRNVDVATTGLGAPDAELQRIEVRPSSDGQGSVTIHVRDGSGGRASLTTTLQGARLRAAPFAP